MAKQSQWGTKTFKKGNKEDDRVKSAIMQKLMDLGEDPFDKSTHMKPDEIHKMDPGWQPYSAKSFGEAVRQCRKVIGAYKSKFSFIFQR